MNSTSSLALSALSIFRSVNPHATKGRYTMRKNLNWVALMGTLIVIVFGLAGCGDDPPGVVYTPTSAGLKSLWPDVCESDSTAKPANCTETLTVTACYEIGDTDGNGLEEVYCESVELTRAAGELEATASFSPPPVEAGQSVVAFLSYSGITLGEDYKMETCEDGGDLPLSIHLLPGVPGSLCIQIVSRGGTTIPPGSGTGDVSFVPTSDSTPVVGCAFDFNSDHLDSVCVVNNDGAVCTGIAVGSYTVSVSCENGTLVSENFAFDVLEDKDTAYTVPVSAPGTTGSGLGDECVSLVDSEGNPVDPSACVFMVDGVPVTPDADAGNLCDGALLKGLDAKVSEIVAVCDDAEGSITTEVTEDQQSEVTITVEVPYVPPTDNGNICVSLKDKDGNPLNGCTIKNEQLEPDPVVSVNPPVGCDSPGDYYFEDVHEGLYDVVATCGTLSGQKKVEVIAEETNHVWMTLLPPATGDLCVGKLGLPIDQDTPTADMGQWIGYGTGGSCTPATPIQLAAMSVTDFSGPSCSDSADSGCAISITGLVVSMKNGFTGYAAEEERVFAVDVTDGNTSTVVYIDTLNGLFDPLP